MGGHEGHAGLFSLPRFVPAPALMGANAGQHEDKRAQDQGPVALPNPAGAFSAKVFRNLVKDIGQGDPRSERRLAQG